MFLRLIKESKWIFIFCSVLTLSSAILNVGLIISVNKAISEDIHAIPNVAVIFFGMVGCLFLFGFLSQSMLRRLGVEVVSSLRKSITGRLLVCSYEQIETLGKSKIYSSLLFDINSIYRMFSLLPIVVFNLFLVVGGFIYLGYLSLVYCIILIALIGGVVFFFIWLSRVIESTQNQLRSEEERLNGYFLTLVDGARELSISLNKKQFFFQSLLVPAVEQVKERSFKLGNQEAILNNIMSLVIFLIFGVIIFFINDFIPVEEHVITGFLITLLFIRNPIGIVVDSISGFINARIAFGRIAALKMGHENDWKEKLVISKPLRENKDFDVVFKNITYQYPAVNGDPGFKIGPINISARTGEAIFITGVNGSGKSTLGKILTGLYRPQGGDILLNQTPIDADGQISYQSYLSVVFSDFYLFDFIVGGKDDQNVDDLVEKWMDELQLNGKVKIENGRMSTTDLSHGQRKRLALIAASVENKPIMVFDEWAADQDPVFRAYFYEVIISKLKAQGKIIFVISHDDKYFNSADRLFEMSSGVVVEKKMKPNRSTTSDRGSELVSL